MTVDDLLSDEGFLYASTPPVEEGDPGRFHALFGRDSLIAALQLLPARPGVANGNAARARRPAGTPLRIPARWRSPAGSATSSATRPRSRSSRRGGRTTASSPTTAPPTRRRGSSCSRPPLGGFEDATRAAGDWLAGALDRGGGLVRHGPGSWPALTQQGWRDTLDPTAAYGGGILRPDGTAPEPPLADLDSQAVAYAALRALGRHDRAGALRARLSTLVPDVMAVEAGDRAVPGAGSQLGWLLWADALEPAARDAAAERLCRPDILTGHGLRTLSSESPVFAPHAYHRGSVWPFDSWLGWGGLRAAGRAEEAERVRAGVLAALDRLGRAPELYAVNEVGEIEPIALVQPRPGVDGRRPLGARERVGRPAAAGRPTLTFSALPPPACARPSGSRPSPRGRGWSRGRPSLRGGRRASPTARSRRAAAYGRSGGRRPSRCRCRRSCGTGCRHAMRRTRSSSPLPSRMSRPAIGAVDGTCGTISRPPRPMSGRTPSCWCTTGHAVP